MGIMANSVSITQFKVVGDFPQGDLFQWVGECLDKYAFKNIEESADELSVGWVRTDDYQRSDFLLVQPFRRDRYLSFTLRKDQRKVPAQLLKFRQKAAELEFLNANPGFYKVPKQKREDIRDAVKLGLLARALPSPAMYDAVWNTTNGLLTLATTSAQTVDLFESEFKKSFPGLRLQIVHPLARAAACIPEELLPALERSNLASSEAILDLIRANSWIGEEFLLWLLFRTVNGFAEFSISGNGIFGSGEPFTAFMNDRLLLQARGEAGVQKVTVAGAQEDFREVLAALKMGKAITEATIHLEKDENAWKLTLKGELFQFASFRSPAVQIEKDSTVDRYAEEEAVFFERMHLLEGGVQLFNSLYGTFMVERLGEGWQAKVDAIKGWLEDSATD